MDSELITVVVRDGAIKSRKEKRPPEHLRFIDRLYFLRFLLWVC